MTKETYDKLLKQGNKVATLSSVLNLLNWDQETYMPRSAVEFRSSQMALLAELIHKEKTSAIFTKNLFSLIDEKSGKVKEPSLSEIQKKSLELWREDTLRDKKLPSSFVSEFSEVTSKATNVWAEAKKNNDFKTFAPHLQKIVDLCRKKSDLIGYKDHPYDPLIDTYEPGMTTRVLDRTFSELKIKLVSLLEKIQSKPEPKSDFLYQEFSHDKQLEISDALLKLLRIDSQYARLDESTHPFTLGIHPTDTRFTTWVKLHNLPSNILGTLHEGGHALYELNLPIEHYGTPICEYTSIGVHESQSRFFETFLGKSFSFWKHFYPAVQKIFPNQLQKISLDEFYQGVNVVKTSKIRVEADELTYCLHIILRFELEKLLLEGKLFVGELPEAWKEKAKEILHLDIESDSEGCLQDVHWSAGILGYFPTYALGNLYAGMLHEKLRQDLPDWENQISEGSFSPTLDWMKTHIHQHGRYYTPAKLIEKVTGKHLSADPYIEYLTKKFSSIYGV